MLTVRLQGPSLIKKRSSLRIIVLQLLSTLTSSARSTRSPYQSSFPRLRIQCPILVVWFHTTHIGFHCLRCVVIVLHLSSWSGNPHLFLSSFNPYLSDPLTLLLLIYLSHDVVFPLSFLSHDIIIVLLILQG